MPAGISPEQVLEQLDKGQLSPLYLFYGPSEFRLEITLKQIREAFVPEQARDFNFQLFYGDEKKGHPEELVADIVDAARSIPFASPHRLVVVRRIEGLPQRALEGFTAYLEDPVETTCLIFLSSRSKPDFRTRFYKKIKGLGLAVEFQRLYDNQIVPWIKRTADELGLRIDPEACAYLRQIVGNRLIDLHSELEKLYISYGQGPVGLDEVKKLAIHSRIFTIFELMEAVASRQRSHALSVLKRYLDEEGREGVLGALGMLNRQVRLIWQTRALVSEGGRNVDVARKLAVPGFQAKRLVEQAQRWTEGDLERAMERLHEADARIKSGAGQPLVFENLVWSLCV
jgi:DNA polymerase-3 subunit delta